MMTAKSEWLAILYTAWAVLLIVTSVAKPDNRRACLSGVAGFAILGVNLLVTDGTPIRWLLRIAALALLAYGAYLAIGARPASDV